MLVLGLGVTPSPWASEEPPWSFCTWDVPVETLPSSVLTEKVSLGVFAFRIVINSLKNLIRNFKSLCRMIILNFKSLCKMVSFEL